MDINGTSFPGGLADFDQIWSALEIARHRPHTRQVVSSTKPFPTHLRFGESGNAREYQLFGWHHPEGMFAWSNGREAFLDLPSSDTAVSYFLNLRAAPFNPPQIPHQHVRVFLGGICIAFWEIAIEGHYFAYLPAHLVSTPQTLVFHFANSASPLDLGLNEDDRELALQFYELWLTPWSTVTF